jgi:hypothetical protein
MGIRDRPISPRSPWQNRYAERLIGRWDDAQLQAGSTPSSSCWQQRELDHERGYVNGLRSQELSIVDLSDNEGDDAVARSIDAIRLGVDVVVQPVLRNGRWFGKPDVL